MKKKSIAFVFMWFFAIYLSLFSQNLFKNPESVVFDKSGERYLVSNKGDGRIVEVGKDNKQSVFNKDQSSIRGLLISNGVLYAACNAGVAAFNLKTGKRLFVIDIKGRKFLNDITSDTKGNLYVSDTGGNKIYKINPKTRDYKVLTENIEGPNGLLFDEIKKRLIAVSWSKNGSIMSINPGTGGTSTILKTKFSGMDGIAVDKKGRIYISSWGTGTVYRFDKDFKNTPEPVSEGYNGPADIYFNKQENILAVPEFKADKVDFVKVEN